jgi:hypothetical protein
MFDHLRSTDYFEGVVGRHFVTNIIAKKILDVGYWRPILFKDTHDFCKSYDCCEKIGGFKTKSLAKLVTTLLEEPHMKWGINFISPIKPVRRNKKRIHFGSYRLCNQVGKGKGT